MKTRQLPKILLAFTAACVMSYSFIACKDDDNTLPKANQQQVSKKITVENGILKFVDEVHFKEVLEQLRLMKSKQELNSWESQFNGFISSRTAYYRIKEEDIINAVQKNDFSKFNDYAVLIEDFDKKSKRLVKQIDGDYFGSLFNDKGLVIIGNDAIKYERSKVFKFRNFTINDFSAFKNGDMLSNISQSDVKIEKIKSKAKVSEISNAEHCTSYYDSNKRFAADYNLYKCGNGGCVLDDGLFRRFSATAMHEKRTLGVWFGQDADELERQGQIGGWGFFAYLNTGVQYNVATLNVDESWNDAKSITGILVKVKGKKGADTGECTCGS